MDVSDILPLARGFLKEAEVLDELLRDMGKTNSPGPKHLWNHPPPESSLARSQTKLLGLLQKINRAVRGPQDYLQELVASNWEKGSLYCLLDNGVLEHLSSDRSITATELALKSSIPEDKLLPMLRLAACDQIIEKDKGEETFRHGLMSQELVNDPGLRAFIGFQLYETRVASAQLANSVKMPNPTWTGHSAFEHAWGRPMEEWHEDNRDKRIRFEMAMGKVATTLDPGHKLLEGWLSNNIRPAGKCPRAIREITWSGGVLGHILKPRYPYINFSSDMLCFDKFGYRHIEQEHHELATAYFIKSALWRCPDQDCIAVLRHLSSLVALNPRSLILFNDLVSPEPGAFEPHFEKAYRRRDVTVMTMHNARLRTATEWEGIFRHANPDFTIKLDGIKFTSHSCRGQWELRLPR